ncbi:cohesin subunit rad21, putative [Entamoeba dispar SAW760]|uniref:Cohesin subunit rad21, putative n=1 Tax=Entamoeba dispar (strain ATCC PRA-260 / SAW760) TaxID=370354 RepID=B0EV41_ENTDS|nr:cohesin subunit rad21, putative [Entamoeba dispar SAW760]EDR21624.1 cohesin subunit rad21, putative [Entamoeba dispar SAW760]|eukprot:EDR21624.1 cohesin subunit rad21, putative [Entamoeba dispar SAW760]
MFYSQVVLTKKGPLAKVWIAAHWEGKLTKQQILAIDLKEAVNAVANPEIPIALRISGHLLLGICRIYSRKVKYLLQDCNDALVKIKLSFRPGAVDAEKAVAPHGAITIPTRQRDFSEDSSINEGINFANLALDLQLDEQLNADDLRDLTGNFTANAQDITLQQDIGNLVTMGSMDEIPLNTLDELLNDPAVLRAPESIQPSELIQPIDKSLIDTTMAGLISAVSNEEPSHEISEKGVSLMEETEAPLPMVNEDVPEIPAEIPQENEVLIEDNGEEKAKEDEGKEKKKKTRKEKKIIYDKATLISVKRYEKTKKDCDKIIREFDLAPGSLNELREEGRRLRGRWEVTNERIKNYIKMINKDEVQEKDIVKEVDVASQKEEAQKHLEEVQEHISTLKPLKHKDGMSDEVSSEEKRRVSDIIPDENLPIQDDIPTLNFENNEGYNEDVAIPEEPFKQKIVTDSWTSRSAKIHNFLKRSMGERTEMSYKAFVQGKKRKPVVGCFFELLVLKTQGVIDLQQQEAYDDIIIKQTDTFMADVETQV